MSELPGETFTIDGVADYLMMGKRTVYSLVAANKLSSFKLGGAWRRLRDELNQWVASRIGKAKLSDGEVAE
ncbi:helix-turn-helix domain-containing protein [Pulveribacter sp.]|uniref:helix-turn-helix domain-containing protein n=1 Tax=Pulveribacter sp. TaxID=2678893 RepID=UPI0028AB4E8A|nr:helix-turn-helix domain-containing protein [Pulveribacter sp.]